MLAGKRKLYWVKYRLPGQWLWRKVKNVHGDFILHADTRSGNGRKLFWPVATRVLELDNKTRMEIPMAGAEFVFDSGRIEAIEANLKAEKGD